MKKIFTILIMAVVAFSMNAMPQVMKAGKKSAPVSPQREAKALVQSKIEQTLRGKRVNREEARAKLVKAQSTFGAPAKVANAVQETLVFNFDEFYEPPYYYEDYGEWACTLASEDGYYFLLDWYGEGDTYCGTYTLEDFYLGYTYIETPDDFVDVEDITMTIKVDTISQYLLATVLDATILGYDGNTYELHLIQEMYLPKSTVESVVTGASLTVNEEDFVLTGKNNDLDLTLTVAYPYPAAEFSKAYFDLLNTKVVYKGVQQELLTANLVSKAQKQDDGTVVWLSTFEFYNQDTVLHVVDITAPMAAAAEVVEVEIVNLEMDDSYSEYTGSVYMFGSSTEYDIYLGIPGYAAEAGTYSEGVLCYVTDLVNDVELTSFYTEVVMKESATSAIGWECDVVCRCPNNKEYQIHMTFEVPEPTQIVDVKFEKSCQVMYYPEYGDDLQFFNVDDKYEVSLDVLDVAIGESFTMENMDKEYTWLWIEELAQEVIIADVTGTLSQKGDTTYMNAAVITADAVQYNVEMWYVVPTATDTVDLVINNTKLIDQVEAQGMFQIAGYTADSLMYASFLVLNAEQLAGTYVNEGKLSNGVCDFAGGYTYVFKYIDKANSQYENYPVVKGEAKVEVDADNNLTLTAAVLCTNAVFYNITMTVTAETQNHLQYDATEGAVDRTYTSKDNVKLTDGIAEYGMVYWSVKAADGSDGVALYFFAAEADEDIVIPVGTYPIDYTEDYGTVLANSGVQNGSVYPSFYANYNAQGQVLAPLWFFVGGTVEVSKNEAGKLHMEINAVNSYDVPVHMVYDDDSATGVENVDVPSVSCEKIMKNGQLVIIRDGKAYNAQGAQVK